MNKTKKWLTAATLLVLIGFIIFAVVMTMIKWDVSELSTDKLQTSAFDITDPFDNISVTTDTADVKFALSDDGKIKVVCYEYETRPHTVTVENGTLNINVTDQRKWYEYISLNFNAPKLTVYLPSEKYNSLGDIEISLSTGDVTLNNFNCAGDVKIFVSTGKVNLTDLKCKNLLSQGSTGNMYLKNVIATEKFSLKRSTGSVKLDSCDAAEILITTDTGNVTGSLLTEKVFLTNTDTGKINVPQTASGGRCEITTDTGDIKITIN